MNDLSLLWAGHLFGTNTGKLFLELEPLVEDGAEYAGVLRVADDHFGVSLYEISLKTDGEKIEISGTPSQNKEGVEQGSVEASGRIQPRGAIFGQWKTSIGTGGAFELYPHQGARHIDGQSPAMPEQFYTTNRDIGALRLYKDDVLEIIGNMKRKFPGSRVVVSRIDRGAELSQYSEEFERIIDNIGILNWIKLQVNGTSEPGVGKSLIIDLGSNFNRVTTQGADETWVLGEAEATASHLRVKERKLSTAIGRYRININQIILVCAFVAMPDLNLMPRAIFVFSVLIFIFGANKATTRLIPNFAFDSSSDRPGVLAQIWPSALSWLISATAGFAASLMYGGLKSLLH